MEEMGIEAERQAEAELAQGSAAKPAWTGLPGGEGDSLFWLIPVGAIPISGNNRQKRETPLISVYQSST